MTKSWPWEKTFCIILTVGILVFIFPAYGSISQEKKNNKRIFDLTQIKGSLERYNNKTGFFPPLNNCAVALGAMSVTLDPDNSISPLLVSSSKKVANTYCATNIKTFTVKNKNDVGANGFYLETNLLGKGESLAGFDDTPGRNFNYKQYTDQGVLKYRICGGDEKSCDIVSPNN